MSAKKEKMFNPAGATYRQVNDEFLTDSDDSDTSDISNQDIETDECTCNDIQEKWEFEPSEKSIMSHQFNDIDTVEENKENEPDSDAKELQKENIDMSHDPQNRGFTKTDRQADRKETNELNKICRDLSNLHL